MSNLSEDTNSNSFLNSNVQNIPEHLDSDVEMTPIENSETTASTSGSNNNDWHSNRWSSNNWKYKTWNHTNDWHFSKNENHTTASNTHTTNRTENDDIEMASSSSNTWNDWNNWSDWNSWKHSDWGTFKWNMPYWSEKEGERMTIYEENFPPNHTK